MENTRESLAETLRQNLKRLRKGKFTQESLAEATGLSHSYIRQIESKQSSASLDTLVQISNALDCEVSELLRTEPKTESVPQTIVELSQVIVEQENKIKALELSDTEKRIVDYHRTSGEGARQLVELMCGFGLDSMQNAELLKLNKLKEATTKALDKKKSS